MQDFKRGIESHSGGALTIINAFKIIFVYEFRIKIIFPTGGKVATIEEKIVTKVNRHRYEYKHTLLPNINDRWHLSTSYI